MFHQMVLSSEKQTKLLEVLTEIVNSIENEKNRKAIEAFFDDFTEKFLMAPASHRANFHNCFPGGLLEHTIRVYTILKDLCAKYATEISADSIKLVALLHDIGKLGDEEAEYYIEQDSTWHREKLGEFYKINDSMFYMNHAHRSIFLCQKYGIELTKEEFQAVLTHDGQHEESNKRYSQKEGTLTLMLTMADYLACKLEKDKYKKFAELSNE